MDEALASRRPAERWGGDWPVPRGACARAIGYPARRHRRRRAATSGLAAGPVVRHGFSQAGLNVILTLTTGAS